MRVRVTRESKKMKRASIFLIIVFFTLSYLCLGKVNRERSEFNLSTSSPLENAPPELVLATTALGGFRGIVVDYLWLRALELQRQGKYFELVQIYDWIGKMEPRIEMVWCHNAWNMAYNISVELGKPMERWMWIKRGIELLRDEGLKYNPKSTLLYKELAWIYQHKIAQFSDEFQWEYKGYLAEEMERILGKGCSLLPEVAAVKKNKEELFSDKNVSALAREMKKKGYDPFSEKYMRILKGYEKLPEPLEEILDEKEYRKAKSVLDNFLRYRELTGRLKLDPEYMLELRKIYGPLDWRLAQSHAIYWLAKGLKVIGEVRDANFDRMILHSVISLFETGRILRTDAGFILSEPDFRFLDTVDCIYAGLEKKYGKDTGMASAHDNFLKSAIVLLYTYGRNKEALKTYKKLRKINPSYRMSLESFIFARIKDSIEGASPLKVSGLIRGLIRQSLMAFAVGDDEKSAGLENLAKLVWNKYTEECGGAERMKLPPFEEIRLSVIKKVLEGEFPELLRKRLNERFGIIEEKAAKVGSR